MSIALLTKPDPALIALLAPLPLAIACALVWRKHSLWAEGIVACCIGLYGAARAQQPPVLPPPIAGALDTDRKVVVQGWVVMAPEAVTGRDGSRLRVAIERVDGIPARATLALAVALAVPDFLPGDAVELTARLRSVRGLANPGVPDSALQVRASGIDVFAGVGPGSAIRQLRDDEVAFPIRNKTILLRAATRVRVALGRAIDGVVSGAAADFLHTAVLGQRRHTRPDVEEGFRAAGATHVLSVSGLHLAAVAAVFFVGVRRCLMLVPRLPLWVEPRATSAVVALPAIAFYTLVTGSAIATVRSALMMAFGLVGVAMGRRNTPLIAIAAAVLVLLAWSPLVMVDLSFQLSVVSVLALAVVVPRLVSSEGANVGGAGGQRVPPKWVARPLVWLGGFAAATVAAGMTTAPLVAHYFGEVTPASPLGNLLLVPLVELVVVPTGLLGATVGAIFGRTCSVPLLAVAEVATRMALRIAELFRHHAPVWLTRSPNTFETAALCIGVASLLASLRRAQPTPSPFRSTWIALGGAMILGAMGSMGGRELARRGSRDLVVTFLDVGQGDAAVVQLPGGATVLVDGGGTYDGSFDPGARVVEPFLRARGITHLDVVALSHPHPDHMGGLHRIVQRFGVDQIWTSGDHGRNPDYWRLLDAARQRGIATPVPQRHNMHGATIEPLGPFVVALRDDGTAGHIDKIGVPEGTTVNDASLVVRVGYGGRSVLFTGDIEASGEGELAGRRALGQTVASDVLKVPHHGSRTSSTTELLDAVAPRMAIISLGWRNRFNFPRPEVVSRYGARGIRLFRTDLDGAITVTITPEGTLGATCQRGCR